MSVGIITWVPPIFNVDIYFLENKYINDYREEDMVFHAFISN